MADTFLEEPIPVGSIGQVAKEALDMPQTAPPGLPQSEWADLMNAAWYIAFMPVLVWSDGATRTLKALQKTLPPSRIF